jgi:transposase-like protein
MGKKRNQYTKECKIETVCLIVDEDRSISEVARELEVAQRLLHRWKKKSEEGKIYDTGQEAKTDIFDYIEIFYNRQRRHSYFGYLSPDE